MSDNDAVSGPVMLAATNMLKPPPAVIGSLNREITLPRTVRLATLAAVATGAVLGFLGTLFLFGAGLYALLYGPALGGVIGWALVNFSPLREESMARWLGLQANQTRKRKLVVDGRQVRLYVGIAPLRRTAVGTVRMLPGGVPVDSVRWDARGVPQQEIPGAARLTAATRLRKKPALSDRAAGEGPRVPGRTPGRAPRKARRENRHANRREARTGE
ncbi:hypothetical protein [Actinomadura sp. HBU206391]|uniref:hypothetical protein n=1 Tax=Actinomadura sp. HBU206391 TaxID=2731692 RepID=UPI00164F7936|nr:hypothetical protein [Actinomadura sp. HBU206391]MBC6458084.1 hypothetical protein [Actinomadura sp. HBU206391]